MNRVCKPPCVRGNVAYPTPRVPSGTETNLAVPHSSERCIWPSSKLKPHGNTFIKPP